MIKFDWRILDLLHRVLKLMLLTQNNRLSNLIDKFYCYLIYFFSPNRDHEKKIGFEKEPFPGQGPQTGGLH